MRYPLLSAPRPKRSVFEPQIHADFADVGSKLTKWIKINSAKILFIRLKIVGGKGALSIVGLNFPCS
jgi:hypothetical protein